VKRTTEAIERDMATLIRRGHDLRDEAAELSGTAKELAKEAERLKEDRVVVRQISVGFTVAEFVLLKDSDRSVGSVSFRSHSRAASSR
jgi:hypothetical protein